MRILIVRPGAIGDSLLTFPVISALRTRYKHCFITYVGNAAVLPLARAARLVDQTFDYGSLLWTELFASDGIRSEALQEVMRETDYVVCWLRDIDGVVLHNLQSQGIHRIVVAPGRPSEERNVHIVRYLAETLELAETIDTSYHIEIPPEAIDASHKPLLYEARPFAIHPGSGGARKCWPVSRFATVIKWLWQRNVPVLLLSGPADEERVTQLFALMGMPPKASLLTSLHNLPLLNVAAQLQHCRGYLGNDSGITHLAALLGVITVALFGPSNPVIWHPVGPYVRVLHEIDMTQIQVDHVMSCIETIS